MTKSGNISQKMVIYDKNGNISQKVEIYDKKW